MMPGDGETVTSLPGGSLKLPDTARTGRVSAMSHGSVTGTFFKKKIIFCLLLK